MHCGGRSRTRKLLGPLGMAAEAGMMSSLKHLLFTVLSTMSLLLCAVSSAVWVQSYRQRYSLTYGRAVQRPTEWVPSSWTMSLEPACVYIGHSTQAPRSTSDVLPGPHGETRIILRDPPPTGWWCSAEAAGGRWDWAFNRQDLRCQLLRFAWVSANFPNDGGSFRLAVIPLYAVVLTAAVLPVLWLRGRRRRHQAARYAAADLCPRCAYDLRASPGRCPECGAERESKSVVHKRPLDDHTPRRTQLPDWAEWALATTVVGLAVAMLAVLVLAPLSFVVQSSPTTPPVAGYRAPLPLP